MPELNFEDFLGIFSISNEHNFCIDLKELWNKNYCNEFIEDLPKQFDVFYFLAKDYLEKNKKTKLDDNFFSMFLSSECRFLDDVFEMERFKSLKEKIEKAAKKYFSDRKQSSIKKKGKLSKNCLIK